jgi:hypothetical protein
MARRSMFVALTKSPTPPPAPNGPASAFEGPGVPSLGAFLHNQFMQGRPISGRHEPEEPERSPAPRERVPFSISISQKEWAAPLPKFS